MIAQDEEELLALQQAADIANAALTTALQAADEANAALLDAIAGGDAAVITAAQQVADIANAALTAAQQTADEANKAIGEAISEELKISHIITNSNNGGSFIIGDEGNHSAVDGDVLSFTFAPEVGFDLIWLRIGNTKIAATDSLALIPYLESFNKKNLTMHAHFKKDKDYVPETIVEETSLDEEVLQEDEDGNNNDKENGNKDDKENGNGNSKEKSNNGKKK